MLSRGLLLQSLMLGSLASLAFSTGAFAKELQCDKLQKHCVTDSTDLTIGDRVGIFNDDGELVAKGEVRAMKGERRAVLINEHYSNIHKGYRLALLDVNPGKNDAAMAPSYRIYHEPPKMTIGASVGYSEVSIGQGSPATEFSAYGEYRAIGNLQLVARGVYEALEGQVTRVSDLGSESLPISMTGMGLLGGVAYVAREGKLVSFRGEAAVGGMQVSATAGGDKQIVDNGETNAHLKNGVGVYGRGALGTMINFDAFHMTLDYAPSLVYQAFANTLAAGVQVDLK